MYAFDTETHAEPFPCAPPMVCLSWADAKREGVLLRDAGLDWFGKRLREGAHLVGTNIPFDLAVMCNARPALLGPVFDALGEGRLHDIALRQTLISIADGTAQDDAEEPGQKWERWSLARLASLYLGIDVSAEKTNPNSWRLRFKELDGLALEGWPEAALSYVKNDARFPLEIFNAQEFASKGNEARVFNLKDEARQVRAGFAFYLSSLWGLESSPEAVARLRERVRVDGAQAEAIARGLGIIREDGTRNTEALALRVSAAYGWKPPRTAKGKVSTDRDTLAESGDEELEALARHGKAAKLLNTFLPALTSTWIRPSYDYLKATGRVSGNWQQLPKQGGIRETIHARRGFLFACVDATGGELRTVAQHAIDTVGFSRLGDALNQGKDPHAMAGASFHGTPYEVFEPRARVKPSTEATFRELGKTWNFGKLGGMAPAAMVFNAREKTGTRFCQVLGRAEKCGVRKVTRKVNHRQRNICAVCEAVAAELDHGWLRAFPEMPLLFNRARSLTSGGRLAVSVSRAGRMRGGCRYTQYLNTPFQGMLADIFKDAMFEVSRLMHTARSSPLWGGHICLQVHDELVCELPEESAAEGADVIAGIVRDTMARALPDLAGACAAEVTLSRVLSKNAKSLRDSRGRLVVWELVA